MQKLIQKIKLPALVLLGGIIIVCMYFLPAYQGKVLKQHDIVQALAMQHEITEFKERTGKEALWTNNLFSGMPSFMGGVEYKNPVIGKLLVPFETFFKAPSSYGVYYFIGFFLLLMVMGCNPWVSLVGALLFAFSTYNIVILDAGHTTKARCIGLMPFIVAGVILLFQKKYIWGAMLSSLFLFFQIKSNHPQIVYYMFITLGFYFAYQLFESIKQKTLKDFAIATSIFVGCMGLAIAANFSQLWVTYEYSKDTMRGGSELAAGEKNSTKNQKGLDKDYAFQWSYGLMETMTILIPDVYGGASGGTLDEKSKVFTTLSENNVPEGQAMQFTAQIPTYWGPKPFTSGPVYYGAIVCFLFLLGIFIIKDNWRWWIFGATILSVMMAWGKNLAFFNYFLFDHLPMYSKFRTPEMILVIGQFTFPLFAMLTLKRILDGGINSDELLKKIQYATIAIGILLLVFVVMPGLFLGFEGDGDAKLKEQLAGSGEALAKKIMEALRGDRESMARMDALRSLIFVLIAAAALWLLVTEKIKKQYALAIIGLAALVDLWGVDKRYLNDDKFIDSEEVESAYVESPADQQILTDKTLSYRIFNTDNPFNDALPSYHHKNIGGYNPAKLGRYQDIIDSCLSKGNMQVFNMLNAKYFLRTAQNGQQGVQQNPGAMGNAWMADTVKWVHSPNEEIMALKNFNPKTTAIIDASKFKEDVKQNIFSRDSTAKITLTKNELDLLEYDYSASKDQLVVFSEVFYADKNGKGWQAFVDDKPADHFRVNYILRGMVMPAGAHKITFKFEPKPFLQGQKISFAGSLALALLLLVGLASWVMKLRKEQPIVVEEKPKAKDKK